ncbi:peptidase M19 [Deinococcus koreensis]|uniref:Peptidase M19 n=1 Tax=Deinococcus koreensis TaxID=2054903 RepID=A0A2K3V1W3_9DEIO|nr:peptidase M19 [Deinococcus koreensis]
MRIDGHLDLAYNGLNGRDLRLPLEALRASDPVQGQIATVSFPELRTSGLGLCLGTLFALPQTPDSPHGYTDAAGARAQALAQLEQYRRWEDEGLIRLLRSRKDVVGHLESLDSLHDGAAPLGVVLLMEGADPLRTPDDLPWWAGQGVRIVGPAWGATRYAGGTDAPGPLTALGRELVGALRDLQLTVDASHLDDAAFWDTVEIGPRLIASHSNARALVRGNRHLSDDMARAVAATDGVIGLVYLSSFIEDGWQDGQAGTPLSGLARHAAHYAGLVGWERVALGSDMDGGFGAEKTPAGVGRYRDVFALGEHLPAGENAGVLGGNWARWLSTHL